MPAMIAGTIGIALFNLGAFELATDVIIALSSPIGIFAINTAISLGVSLAAGLLFRPAVNRPTIKPSDAQQAIRQPVPARWKSFGQVRLAGPVFWFDSDEANKQLYLGEVLNQGRIDSFVSYHIDDKEVTINGSGVVQTSPYNGVVTKILTRFGEDTETTYSEIDTAFSVDNVRGDGLATMLGVFTTFGTSEDQLKDYPNGIPRLRATIKASVVWDPRDHAQDREDTSTWAWSENPVVCLLSYLLDPDGFAIPYERIGPNLAEWKAAADICDEQIISINAGGYENRYRMAGTFLFTDPPANIVSKFLSTCDGRCWQKRDGTVGISVGKFVQPTALIADRDIIDYEITRGSDPLTAIAGIRAQYMSPDHDYREQDADPWPDGDTVMELGEDRVANLDLTWVPSFSQTRRIMKRHALREAADWRGTIRTTLAGLRAIDERYINVEITELGISETFEVGRFSLDPNTLQCTFEIVSVGAEIDQWDPTTEEGTPPSQPILSAWSSGATTGVLSVAASDSIRNVIPGTDVVAAGAQCRLVFQTNNQGGFACQHVSIVPRSGSTDDGTTTPTEVTFAGASGFSIDQSDQIYSDWLDFPIVIGTDYLVIIDATAPRQWPVANHSGATAYKVTSASYNQQTVSSSTASDYYYALTEIQVRAGA